MAAIEVIEYTDPSCPFAWSAEPARRRIEWLYGEAIHLEPRMVGLHESGASMEAAGLTTTLLSKTWTKLARSHHMPMDTRPAPRLAGTIDACRAVVAVRLTDPGRERAMLRALRIEHFAGHPLDEAATLHAAARRAGVDPTALDDARTDPETERALSADTAAARAPSPEALALPGKLATTEDGPSGHRYTCPSWELTRDGRTVTVPGFQPLAAYEVAIANLAPELRRRPDPESAADVLAWAGEPLASAEVAAVLGSDLLETRAELAGVADEAPLGTDGMWTLRPTS